MKRPPAPVARLAVGTPEGRFTAPSWDRWLFLVLHRLGIAPRGGLDAAVHFVQPGMRVLDIGANTGLFSVALARKVGPRGRIIAFEPEARNFASLEENIRLNACGQIAAHRLAVGKGSGKVRLYTSALNRGDCRLDPPTGRRNWQEVEVVALDEFLGADERIDFVKIDAQGSEGRILEGMHRLLRNNPRMVLMLEFWPYGLRRAGCQPLGLLESLRDKGFELFSVAARKARLDLISDPAAFAGSLGPRAHADIWASPAEGAAMEHRPGEARG